MGLTASECFFVIALIVPIIVSPIVFLLYHFIFFDILDKNDLKKELKLTTEDFSVDLQNSILDISFSEGIRKGTIRKLKTGLNGDDYFSLLSALDKDTFEEFEKEFDKNTTLYIAIERSYLDREREDVNKFFISYAKILNEKFNKNFTSDEIIDWVFSLKRGDLDIDDNT